jgi:hypothetical protein
MRRSPQLARLPRREAGMRPRVKMLTTTRKRRGQVHPQAFHQLTVPVDFAETFPLGQVFEVERTEDGLVYRAIQPGGGS